MKTLKLLIVTVLTFSLSSCSEDDGPQFQPIESETVNNLYAPQNGGQGEPITGPFTKFDFATGTTTTHEAAWDIAFRGTTIIVNGGESLGTTDEPERTGNAAAYIETGTLSSVEEVNPSLFQQDSSSGYAIPTGSGNGWYVYNPQTFTISPIPGNVLVFRTRDGKYAKMEILSYYKDAPDNPDAFVDEGRHFTFNYVYNPNVGETTF
jgi:hypothetical protein